MAVGDWITEPELHAHHRRGWGPRWRLDSFSARFRFTRLGCFATQIEFPRAEIVKALPKKLLPLILSGIAVTSLFSVRPAQAYTVTLQQVGSDVVATGSGAINLTGLTFASGGLVANGSMGPSIALLVVADGTGLSRYTGFSGPSSFGPGITIVSDSSDSGDSVGIIGAGGFFPGPGIFLPAGYVSGTALSDSSTYNSATFASLGVTPGTYVWTWGTGLPNQNFTLQIGSLGVPPPVNDGGSTVSLLGCALLGCALLGLA